MSLYVTKSLILYYPMGNASTLLLSSVNISNFIKTKNFIFFFFIQLIIHKLTFFHQQKHTKFNNLYVHLNNHL